MYIEFVQVNAHINSAFSWKERDRWKEGGRHCREQKRKEAEEEGEREREAKGRERETEGEEARTKMGIAYVSRWDVLGVEGAKFGWV